MQFLTFKPSEFVKPLFTFNDIILSDFNVDLGEAIDMFIVYRIVTTFNVSFLIGQGVFDVIFDL